MIGNIVDESPRARNVAAEVAGHLSGSGVGVLGVPVAFIAPQLFQIVMVVDDPRRAMRMEAEIASALGMTPGMVRLFLAHGALVVEVPRGSREVVFASHLPAPESVDPSIVPLGVGASAELIAASLSYAPHMLVAGATKAGKSNALRLCAWWILRQGGKVALVDCDSGTFEPFRGKDGVVAFADGADDCDSLVEWVSVQMATDQRIDRLFLLVDEVDILEGSGKAALRSIFQRGRRAGVSAVVATQHPVARILDRVAAVNAGWRVCLQVADASASRVVLGQSGGENLLGGGDALVKVGPNLERVQLALVTSSDIAALPDAPSGLAMSYSAPTGGPTDGEMIEWAVGNPGPRSEVASATMIRERFGIGTDRARRLRDEAMAVYSVDEPSMTTKSTVDWQNIGR